LAALSGWSACLAPLPAAAWGESVAEIKHPASGEYPALPKFAPDVNGEVLAVINSPLLSWGTPTWTRVVRWNSSGKVVRVLNNMATSNPNMMTIAATSHRQLEKYMHSEP